MDTKVKKWLRDALDAGEAIQSFSERRSVNELQSNLMFRSAVERQFEILGESLRRIRDYDEAFLNKHVCGWRGAVSFRNILAHGYDEIDYEIVWGIIVDDLPEILQSFAQISELNEY